MSLEQHCQLPLHHIRNLLHLISRVRSIIGHVHPTGSISVTRAIAALFGDSLHHLLVVRWGTISHLFPWFDWYVSSTYVRLNPTLGATHDAALRLFVLGELRCSLLLALMIWRTGLPSRSWYKEQVQDHLRSLEAGGWSRI